MMKLDEQELMQRLADGDQKAFQVLFYTYYDRVYAFARGILKSDEDANDLVQEVFLKIWNNRGRFKLVRNFGTYLYVLTRNAVYDFLETKYVDVHFEPVEEMDAVDDLKPVDLLIEKDLQRLIEGVVEQMPLQRKRVYTLSRVEGLNNSEIAEKLNLSKKTVEYHLSLALKELRNIVNLVIILYFC